MLVASPSWSISKADGTLQCIAKEGLWDPPKGDFKRKAEKAFLI